MLKTLGGARIVVDHRLIGLYSPAAQSGKTFAATVLTHQGFELLSFAEPIKSMAREFLVQWGFSSLEATQLVLVDKHCVIPGTGITVRQLLQRLGTEFGRQQVCDDVWVRCWLAKATRYQRVVADDVRFLNEAKAIKAVGGQVWMIRRHGVQRDTNHPSEGALDGWDGFDAVIDNNGTLVDFRRKIDAALWG